MGRRLRRQTADIFQPTDPVFLFSTDPQFQAGRLPPIRAGDPVFAAPASPPLERLPGRGMSPFPPPIPKQAGLFCPTGSRIFCLRLIQNRLFQNSTFKPGEKPSRPFHEAFQPGGDVGGISSVIIIRPGAGFRRRGISFQVLRICFLQRDRPPGISPMPIQDPRFRRPRRASISILPGVEGRNLAMTYPGRIGKRRSLVFLPHPFRQFRHLRGTSLASGGMYTIVPSLPSRIARCPSRQGAGGDRFPV
jgi:hypothetical protein